MIRLEYREEHLDHRISKHVKKQDTEKKIDKLKEETKERDVDTSHGINEIEINYTVYIYAVRPLE